MFTIFAWIFVGSLALGMAILTIELIWYFIIDPFVNIFRKNPKKYECDLPDVIKRALNR